MRNPSPFVLLYFAAISLTSCQTATNDVCSDPGLSQSGSLAIVTSPAPGERLVSGATVKGCGRAFEGALSYQLKGRTGQVLSSGHIQTGAVDGPAPFSFTVRYEVDNAQLGHLFVYEEDVSDGEGFPPSRSVIPVLLVP